MTYVANTPQLGIVDLSTVDTLAPGPVNLVGTNKSGRWPQLGAIVTGWDPTYGGGEFIYLKGGTGVIAGMMVYYDSAYVATLLPAVSTSKKTGRPIAVAIGTVTATQYGWFQIQGQCLILKTAVLITADSAIYISATAGRFYATASAGAQIVGARTINTASVTTTTSTVLCVVNRPAVQGYS